MHDYRYGHKPSRYTTRRSQMADEAKTVVEAALASTSNPVDGGGKTDQTPAAAAAESAEPALQPVSSRPPELEKALARATKRARAKALKEPPLLVDANAEAAHTSPQESPIAKEQPREGRGVSLVKWFGLLIVSSLVIGWLAYAPFFLAFAEGMGWIDANTRARWDSQLLSVQAISQSHKEPKAAVSKPVPLPQQVSKPVESASSPSLAFTFYEELPKAVLQLDVQPLPVLRKVPVYLQVASVADYAKAKAERHRLAQLGYLTQISAQLQQGKSLYVLRLGPYEERVINRLKLALLKLGIEAKEVNMIIARQTAVDSRSRGGMKPLPETNAKINRR